MTAACMTERRQKEDTGMMRLRIDGNEYTAETATGLIGQIKGLHWHAGDATTAEDYIALQEEAYRKVTGRRMKLPKGADTEARAREMFRKCAETGAWEYEERGSGDE